MMCIILLRFSDNTYVSPTYLCSCPYLFAIYCYLIKYMFIMFCIKLRIDVLYTYYYYYFCCHHIWKLLLVVLVVDPSFVSWFILIAPVALLFSSKTSSPPWKDAPLSRSNIEKACGFLGRWHFYIFGFRLSFCGTGHHLEAYVDKLIKVSNRKCFQK